MIRSLVLVLALVSALSLQVTFKTHLASAPVLDITALRAVELQKHNAYRALHGCPPLKLSNTINTVAQNYANTIANNHNMTHSGNARNGTYGENLYWSWGSPSLTYTPGTASDSWYSEEKLYNYTTFKSNDPSKPIGHFTAMIWKSATSVGFGYKVVPENKLGMIGYAIYVVANYSPVTNIQGLYEANVPKKI